MCVLTSKRCFLFVRLFCPREISKTWYALDQKENLLCLLFQPKRQKKEKKEVPKDKKQDVKEVAVDHEEPASPLKTAEEAGKPQGSYALADMDKATFDEVRPEAFFSRFMFSYGQVVAAHMMYKRGWLAPRGFRRGGGGTFNSVYLTELLRVGTFSHVHTSKKMAAKIYNKICW